MLGKLLGKPKPGFGRVASLGLSPDRGQRSLKELLQGAEIPKMPDRAVRLHDKDIIRRQWRRWGDRDRVLAEPQRVEVVSGERSSQGAVSDGSNLPALGAVHRREIPVKNLTRRRWCGSRRRSRQQQGDHPERTGTTDCFHHGSTSA